MEQAELIITAVGVGLALAISAIAILAMRKWRSESVRAFCSDAWTYLRLLVYVLIGLSLFFGLVAVLGPVGLACWIIGLFVFFEVVRKYRATRQYGLLWLLTVSAERSIPLGPAVDAFAQEYGNHFGRRVRRLAAMLDSGVSLANALSQCGRLVPPSALPMIRVGCESGALAPALRQAATAENFCEPIWMGLIGKLSYLLLLPVFGLAILVFMMWWIVPKFQGIFADFGMALPLLTQALVAMSTFLVNYWFLLMPAYWLGLFLLVYVVMRYYGWTQWDLPGIAKYARRLDSARILDALALVARQQQPLTIGIGALAQSYPKHDIRRRLRQTLVDIESGGDWSESLCRRGLIGRPELGVLRAAQRVGNLPWALAEMADSGRRRLAYRVEAMVQTLFPPIVVLIGLVVMFIVVALFLPLISLIQNLT